MVLGWGTGARGQQDGSQVVVEMAGVWVKTNENSISARRDFFHVPGKGKDAFGGWGMQILCKPAYL